MKTYYHFHNGQTLRDGRLLPPLGEWLNALPDPPVPGAFDFIRAAQAGGFVVAIHSCRCCRPEAVAAMEDWFLKHGLGLWPLAQLEFWLEKPPAVVYVDDRAVPFYGLFPPLSWIRAFRPWHGTPIVAGAPATARDATESNQPCSRCGGNGYEP